MEYDSVSKMNYHHYLPPENLFDLTGKNYAIFGGSSGIGLGMAVGLGKAGASMLLIGRNKSKLDSSLEFLKQQQIEATGIQGSIVDTTVLQDIDNYLDKSERGIDGVILSAALSHIESSENYPLKVVKEIIDTNLYSQFVIAQWACKKMKNNGGGIIFISSGSSIKAMPKNVIYSLLKVPSMV